MSHIISRRAMILLAFLGITVTAMAHRYHAALSTIERDASSGAVEIEHRLFMHDLEPVLLQLSDQKVDLDSKDGEALIRRYVESRFAIVDSGAKPLPLQWVGVELDQTYARVYQEMASAPALNELTYVNQLLTEINAQVNTVNLSDGGQQVSLMFTAKVKQLKWPTK